MVVIARPDLIYAIVGRLLSFPELTELVNSIGGWEKDRFGEPKGSGARIAASIGEFWQMPTRSIWLQRHGGPPGDYEIGIKTTRIDFRCYGATGHEANDVWAMLDAVLVPATGERQASFSLNGVNVIDIRPEADAFADREPQTNYPYVWQSYIVTWRATA